MSTTPDPSAPPSLGSDQELSDALLEGMRSDRESEDARSDGLDDEDIGGGSGESGDGRPTMTGGTRVDEVTAHHDVVFRDKISNYYGASRAPAREPSPLPVGRDVLDDIRHAFVFPDRFQEIVVKQSFLILRVRVGQGGSTAAMRLALDAGASTIKELAPDTKLRWLTTARMENGVGYVLCNAASAVLGELNEFEVGRLREALGRQGAWLILTVDPRTPFPDSLLADCVAELGDPPSAVDVLAAHLRRQLRSHDPDGSRTAEILGDADVLSLLAESEDRDDRVARAARYARILADAAKADDFALDRIRDQLTRLNSNSFEAWFEGLDPSTRCFVIALAALPDFSYEVVSDAAAALGEALPKRAGKDADTLSHDPFAVGRTARLEAAFARVTYVSQQTRYGPTPVEIVRFLDRTYPRRVLNRIWTEHAEVRSALLQWLRDLARHPIGSVRHGAARAVGVLASQAFDYVRRYVIWAWASSTSPTDRQAAAFAVTVPAADPTLSAVTRRMLYHWHLDTSGPTWRNTAARAYGQLGLTDLDTALDAFCHLATETEHGLPKVVANCVTLLIVRSDEKGALKVLERVSAWAAGQDYDAPADSYRADTQYTRQQRNEDIRARTFTAYFAFLTAAVDAVLTEPVDDRPEAVAWPGLLWLAEHNPALHNVIARLWAEALVNPIAHATAEAVLGAWANRIDSDPCGRTALIRLMSTASRTHNHGRIRGAILRQARLWAAAKDPAAPRTARELTHALTSDGESE